MSSFSEQLKNEAAPIWRAIFAHPFLREIKDGTLPVEKSRYYLTQDYQYLEGFGRTVVMAMAKAPNSQTLEELSHRVMTPIERPLHHQLLQAADVSLDYINEVGWLRRLFTALAPRQLPYCPVRGPTTSSKTKWGRRNTPCTASGRVSTLRACWRTASMPGVALLTPQPSRPGRVNLRPSVRPFWSAAVTSTCSGTWPTAWRVGRFENVTAPNSSKWAIDGINQKNRGRNNPAPDHSYTVWFVTAPSEPAPSCRGC